MVDNKFAELKKSICKATHSTERVMYNILEDICRSLESNWLVLLSLLDLSATFDMVDHGILLHRLDKLLRVHGAALRWCASYLCDRHMKFTINGTTSTPKALECSVPQGSLLDPWMYADYTLPFRPLILLIHGYTDDQHLIWISTLSEHDQISAAEHIERAISAISTWMYDNKIKFYPKRWS